MKNKDLQIIKKKYGEKFARYCRSAFSTILEEEGLLTKIITEKFGESRFLYDDIIKADIEHDFKNYIYSFARKENEKEHTKTNKTPQELMKKAGYTLYKCETDEEVKDFIRFYESDEVLCTFRDKDRINTNDIFFAVKDNVDEIKRDDFKNPLRQDEYGTSVISLQFTKKEPSTLSIKNRYNHTVPNCDATFSNDLENITAGLTQSFIDAYGYNLLNEGHQLDFPGYVLASDGKFYKYNYELMDTFYCPDNIMVTADRKVKQFDKNNNILLDYFLLDLKNKSLSLLDTEWLQDSFVDGFASMDESAKIKVQKDGANKRIIISKEDHDDIEVTIDNRNRIVEYSNASINTTGDNFLQHNEVLSQLEMPNTTWIGDNFLSDNRKLKQLYVPKAEFIGDDFLRRNKAITDIDVSNTNYIGNKFLESNRILKELDIPKATHIGSYFLSTNRNLEELTAPNATFIGRNFLWANNELQELNLPKAVFIDKMFLYFNDELVNLNIASVEKVGSNFLRSNTTLKQLNMPSGVLTGNHFLYDHPFKNQFVLRNRTERER